MKRIAKIEFDGNEDVYDIEEDSCHNFTLANGLVVHNSQWGAKDAKIFMPERFKVLVGNSVLSSKVLEDGEDVTEYEGMEEVQIIDVPMDFYDDFMRDTDTALRDLAGVSTVAITPFIRNRKKIMDAVDDSYQHPFTQEVWDMTDRGKFLTEALFKINEFGERVPRFHPEASRHVHIDASLRGDATGLAIGHIYGYKEIRKKVGPIVTVETRPLIQIDLMLRIHPRMGEDIIFQDIRKLIYALHEMGMPIRYVSMDSFQSADSIQAFKARGYESEVVSVDRPMKAYDTLKQTLYEDRLKMYPYQPAQEELRRLEFNAYKGKVDHPDDYSKDVADAIAAIVFTLATKYPGEGTLFYSESSRSKPGERISASAEADDAGDTGFEGFVQVD